MTRLLFPEAFGLMVIVNIVLSALQLFSDVGIRAAVIVKPESKQEGFLNTAWTMVIIRSFIIAGCTILLAGPIAVWYEKPQLETMLMIVAAVPVILAFGSPQIIAAQRDVKMKPTVLIDTLAATLALIITISLLQIWPSAYVLVCHMVVQAIFTNVISHIVYRKQPPALCWDKKVVIDIIRFGKCIVLSSTLTFLTLHGDKLIVSQWITPALLGVFSIALNFSLMFEKIVGPLSDKLFFPVFSELKHEGKEKLNTSHQKIRLIVYGFTFPVIFIGALFGDQFISLLYDERYSLAGPMLQVLCIGSMSTLAVLMFSTIPLSHGHSKVHSFLLATKSFLMLGSMLVGGILWEFRGLIGALSFYQFAYLPILLVVCARYGVKVSVIECSLFILTLSIILLFWSSMGMPLALL